MRCNRILLVWLQEWIWAMKEADEQAINNIVIPELTFVGADGSRFKALNAQLFRVDSLEGDQVGQALLIKNWVPVEQ